MIQKVLLILLCLFLTLVKPAQALVPIEVNLERKITLPTNTPTPVKLIKVPSIRLELKTSATPTAIPTITTTPTVTTAPTVTKAKIATPTTELIVEPTVKVEVVKEIKEITKETVPWYLIVTIVALIGITVVQAWPKKLDKE